MRYRLALLLLISAGPLCLMQQAGCQVGGYVREETTNAALESVSLEILSSGTRAAPSTVSNIDGQFHFGGLRDGDFYIIARKDGYESTTVSVSVMAGSSPTALIYLKKTRSDQPNGPGGEVSARQLAIPPNAREAFEKGSKLLYEKADLQKAISQFQRAIDAFSAYYEAYAQIGVADYRLSKFTEAEQALRRSIELSASKYPDALLLMAQMLNDQQRFSDAEANAREAIAAGDTSWHGPYELARSLVGLKRGAEAEVSATQAAQLKPDNPNIYLVLANAHIQQQKFSSVVHDFDDYLKLAPDAPGSDQIRQRRDRMREALQHTTPREAPHW
jgi:tetratricopeptide (TPR) repeat protein